MDTFLDLIDSLQNAITQATVDGALHLIDPLTGLAVLLAALAFATNFEMYFTPATFNFGNIIVKVLQVCFCFWLIRHWVPVISMVRESGMMLGAAAGDTEGYITPSNVISGGAKQVFSALYGLWDGVTFSLDSIGIFLIGIVALVVALYGFLRIAFTIFMVTAEFSIVGSLAVILIPFMVLRWTASIAEKAWGILLASFVKLTVATFMVSLLANEISNAFGATDTSTKEHLADSLPEMITAALSIFFLAWVIGHVVDYAGDMVRGMAPGNTPTLRDMVRGGVGMARGTYSTVRSAYGAGRATAHGVAAAGRWAERQPVVQKAGQWWLKYGNGLPL